MTTEKKEKIKGAFGTFIKALIPPVIALISAILTTIVSDNSVAVGTTVGSVTGYISNHIIG